jgi:hypothetical protein
MEVVMTRVAAAPPAPEKPLEPDVDASSLVQRPDGWYWLADDGRQEMGPFPTAGECLADMRAGQEGREPGAVLREAEGDIGVADWIDPDTDAPAELNAPHIEDQ